MRARGAALAAALALAGLVPPSRAEAQCLDVDDCLEHYTKSRDFWTKKEMFTYLAAVRAADWKTPEEFTVSELGLTPPLRRCLGATNLVELTTPTPGCMMKLPGATSTSNYVWDCLLWCGRAQSSIP